MEFFQAFSFVIKYKDGSQNHAADKLSHWHSLLSTMQVKVVGFEVLKKLCEGDIDFGHIW